MQLRAWGSGVWAEGGRTEGTPMSWMILEAQKISRPASTIPSPAPRHSAADTAGLAAFALGFPESCSTDQAGPAKAENHCA